MANSPGRAAVDVGSVIADTYTLEALLGRGGMGAVFLASHKRLAGKQVAIKILHTEIADTDVVARFKREAEIAAKLNHPNIVGVIDYNVAPDGMPYLVLDYLEGETLAQRIARGPMALDPMLSILRQVGSGLAAAHRAGIVHRDLKPQNIFLVPTEVDGRMVEIAKVLDFGISKIRGSQTVMTQESTLLGTPQYMAPEQATGQHALVDERTDVFALGAIVYEMLSGQPAFGGASIPEVVFKVVYEQPVPLAQLAPGAPPEIVDAVAHAMAKPPDERFPTVAAFVEAVTGQPLTVPRGTSLPYAAAPGSDSAGASRRVATREAFAQTMGSVAGADAGPVNPMLATMAPITAAQPGPLAQGTANARTPASTANTAYAGPAASVAGGPTPAAPTVDLHGRARDAGVPPRRPIGLLIGIALAAAVVAGGVVYVETRPPAAQPQAKVDPPVAPTPPPIAPTPPSKAVDPGAAPGAAPGTPPGTPKPGDGSAAVVAGAGTPGGSASDTPAGTDSAAHPDGKLTAGKPSEAKITSLPGKPIKPTGTGKPGLHDPRPTGPAEPAEDEGDEETRDKLLRARTALQHHEYDQAEQLATAVYNSSSSPRARANARLIHGTAVCEGGNDQEAAQIDLRALQGFHAMHSRLQAICKARGVIQQ